MTQPTYTIKPGDTRAKVAKKFNVSVDELLTYNVAVLGDDWQAGRTVRDPSYVKERVAFLRGKGVPDKQIASALKVSVGELNEKFGPAPDIETAEELNEVEVPERSKKLPFNEIETPERSKKLPFLEVKTPQRSGRFPEVEVNSRRRSGAEILSEAKPTQRGQVPIPQPRQPDPAPTAQLEPVSVPQRAGRFPEVEVTATRVDETPPRVPELEEVVPTQRGQVPVPEIEQLDPNEPWVPAEKAIVAPPEPPKDEGFKLPVKGLKEKLTLPEVQVDASGIMKTVQESKRRDEVQAKGLTRSVMEGLTFDLYDEASAFMDARREDIPYDLARAKYNAEQRDFEMMNPNLSLGAEVGASLLSGTLGFRALESASKMINTARQTKAIRSGKEEVFYQPKSKLVAREGADGKLEQVTVFPQARPVTVVEDLGNGRVIVKDGNKTFGVKESNLIRRSDKAEVEAASNATLGAIEGGFWGFNTGEGNATDRFSDGLIGGIAGLSMGKLIDQFKPATIRGSQAADDDMMISGKKQPKLIGSIRAQSGRALAEAQERLAKARNPDPDEMNPVGTAGLLESQGAIDPFFDSVKAQERLHEAPFSYIDQFQTSPLASTGEKRTGIGGAWDSAKETYKEWAMGVSDRLMLDFSPQWGARVQVGDESALRLLAQEIPQYVDPVTAVLDLEIKDLDFRGLMLDYAKGVADINEVTDYVGQRLGPQMAVLLRRHIDWANTKNQTHISQITGKEYSLPNYLSTRLSFKKKAEKADMAREVDVPEDPSLFNRTRGNFKDGDVDPEDYLPVLATNLRRIMNNERLVQISRKTNMPIVRDMKSVDDYFAAMERHVVDMGLDADLAKRGTELIRENLAGQTRSPYQWIQALNSFGYASTLAGPMSAVLNLHDPMIAAVRYGFGNTMKGIAQPSYDVRSRGIDQNVGEFMNKIVDMYSNDRDGFETMIAEAMRNGTDWLMKGSGFAAMDNMGKSGTIKAVLNHAAEVAARDSKKKFKTKREQFSNGELAQHWGFYFNRPELDIIHNELMRHGGDFTKYSGKAAELLEELGFAGLGQQQLISGMGRPAAWGRHPNLRPMWALRGFAIKQQSLIMREIMYNIALGRTDLAVKFMARYVALAAGSFGLLNESRQWLMGDGEASFSGMIMGMADQIVSTLSLNTIGLNDYQFGRLMESGPIPVIAESLLPLPATRAIDIGKSAYQGVTDPEKNLRTELIDEVPALRQPLNLLQNLSENTDVIPKPLEDLERRIRPGEQR